jgi:hypothetical protein
MIDPRWDAPDPWATKDPLLEAKAPEPPPVRPFDWLPPLGRDGFRRDAFKVPEGHLETSAVCEELAITYRQAQYWVTRGWIPGLTPRGSGNGRQLYWSPEQVEVARRIRDHGRQLEALKANLAACGPHCQHVSTNAAHPA